MEKFTDEQVKAILEMEVRRYELASSKISIQLLMQLHYLIKFHDFPYQHVLEVIKKIEHQLPLDSKPPEPFTKQTELHGLYKVHYVLPSHLAKNLHNELFGKSKKARRKIESCSVDTPDGRFFTVDSIPKLSKVLIDDTYEEKKRASRMTGEWIVMDKVNETYRYLSLACHDDTKPEYLDILLSQVNQAKQLDLWLPDLLESDGTLNFTATMLKHESIPILF